MKTAMLAALTLMLCACSATGGGTQMYGEIRAGVESSRTAVGR